MPDTDHTHLPLEVDAPHRALLDQVLDAWSLEVLAHLCDAPHRWGDIRRAIPAVSPKSLSATLRRLERNGIVAREVVSTRPVAVEYSITALGKTLRTPVEALTAWAAAHGPAVHAARRAYDDELG
ncbi:helix-turn-helix transcriptional regulator [Phycicoccus sp. CSK15P-2]|uniref:winged helix-turn-helix transcriptional regulator n=1 Tax=Phycicoccus sp. CSK15P-2 TaxID=2807627 RepID=UPI001951A793|nr:helix-turn-helix domain-containing protein [Phycicoccus sp. CSK15P-2]MBM6402738.1 helix-turn-helix transcriptional regulator [Phycicoccus sp. CSK15P-2]